MIDNLKLFGLWLSGNWREIIKIIEYWKLKRGVI